MCRPESGRAQGWSRGPPPQHLLCLDPLSRAWISALLLPPRLHASAASPRRRAGPAVRLLLARLAVGWPSTRKGGLGTRSPVVLLCTHPPERKSAAARAPPPSGLRFSSPPKQPHGRRGGTDLAGPPDRRPALSVGRRGLRHHNPAEPGPALGPRTGHQLEQRRHGRETDWRRRSGRLTRRCTVAVAKRPSAARASAGNAQPMSSASARFRRGLAPHWPGPAAARALAASDPFAAAKRRERTRRQRAVVACAGLNCGTALGPHRPGPAAAAATVTTTPGVPPQTQARAPTGPGGSAGGRFFWFLRCNQNLEFYLHAK
jgi:hypothetical protein